MIPIYADEKKRWRVIPADDFIDAYPQAVRVYESGKGILICRPGGKPNRYDYELVYKPTGTTIGAITAQGSRRPPFETCNRLILMYGDAGTVRRRP